ncbi:3'-5' exonuclease, variant 2 [Balamuthia mandrillaris]
MERRKEVAAKKKGVASAGGPKNKKNNNDKKKGKEKDNNNTVKSKQTTEMAAVEENKTVAVENSRKRKRVEISSNWKQLSKTIVKKPKAARTTTDTPDATATEDKANKTLPHLFPEVKSDSKEITQVLALDCEMVGVGVTGEESMLGRVCIVNSHGNIVYDKFVKPQEKVVDYRTKWSGIRKKDLAKAVPFKVVQKEVAKMLKDRIVVGHSLENDFKVSLSLSLSISISLLLFSLHL